MESLREMNGYITAIGRKEGKHYVLICDHYVKLLDYSRLSMAFLEWTKPEVPFSRIVGIYCTSYVG